jgi:hypothetical protein
MLILTVSLIALFSIVAFAGFHSPTAKAHTVDRWRCYLSIQPRSPLRTMVAVYDSLRSATLYTSAFAGAQLLPISGRAQLRRITFFKRYVCKLRTPQAIVSFIGLLCRFSP